MRFLLVLFRRFLPRLVWLMLAALSCSAHARQLNLPQSTDQVVLPEIPRQILEKALVEGRFDLNSPSSAEFVKGLPEFFRDACDEVLGNWGEGARQTARWSVRILVALRTPAGHQALLALRCRSSEPAAMEFYDERPALVSLAGGSATLRFIPLAEECDTCREFFHHVEFSQIVTVRGGILLELRVNDTHNPCCDGGSEENIERLVLLGVPDGRQALSLDETLKDFSSDDSDEDGGDTNYVCRSKIDYSRDIAGNVESIRSNTRCTNNDVAVPDGKDRTYRWNGSTRRFDEEAPRPSKSLSH